MPDRVVFHLTTGPAWSDAEQAGEYRAPSLDEVGFIHCSNLHQVERVARERYAHTTDLVVVALDVAALEGSPLVDEPGDHGSDERFPHVYGTIPIEASVAVHDFAVIEPERCSACGFDGATTSPTEAAASLDASAGGWGALVARPDRWWRIRPTEGVWSPLEYAAHTRDVVALIDWGIGEIIAGRHLPDASGIDPDEIAATAAYNEQDPDAVLPRLQANLQRLGQRADEVPEPDWFRPGRLDGRPTTPLHLLRHAVHEAHHHLVDAAG